MPNDLQIKTTDELEFAIFCIENTAIKLKLKAKQVYELLVYKSDILSKYIVPNYEVLHTQSKEYILQDIIELMTKKGLLE